MRLFERSAVESTPTISVSAYSSGDQVGGVNELAGVASDNGGTVLLEAIKLLDKTKQKAALDIFFFESAPTLVSTDNGEFELIASEALKCFNIAHISAGDYAETKDFAIAAINCSVPIRAAVKTKSIFYVVVTRGTPTYGSTSDLVFKFWLNKP